jgi:hypothetical protein
MGLLRNTSDPAALSHAPLHRHLALPSATEGTNLGKTARYAGENRDALQLVLVRRLSNAEYNYTIRDLTGVDMRPTRELPVDPANPAGFDNSGESLTMSPALLKVEVEHHPPPPKVATVPESRQRTLVVLSLLFVRHDRRMVRRLLAAVGRR